MNFCPSPIGRKTGHSSCQSRFISVFVLNPSEDLRYQPVLVALSSTYRAGGASIFVYQELCAYQVLSDTFTCIIWECGPLWIFKVTGVILYVNSIFMCAAALCKTSLDVSSSISYTSPSTSSLTTYAIETPTSSAATFSMSISINATLSEAGIWRVGIWIQSCNHCRQVSGIWKMWTSVMT